MNILIFWFLIPILTILLPGRSDWFTSNFSVVGSAYPGNLYLFLWAAFTGLSYRRIMKHIIGQSAPFLSSGKEAVLTDLAFILLISSVFFPYLPDARPVTAAVHLILALLSTVLFYLTATWIALRLFLAAPELFALPVCLLIAAILITVLLLALSGFLISSALEIFLTVFAGIWLDLVFRRTRILNELSGILESE